MNHAVIRIDVLGDSRLVIIGDSSTNSRDGIIAAWIQEGKVRDLDAIACIESAKSDITCDDKYIIFQHAIINSQIIMYSYVISQLVYDNKSYRLL